MAKYNKINFSQEGVESLMKMSSDLKGRYDDYLEAKNRLDSYYETVYQDLGVDAEGVYQLLEMMDTELRYKCDELTALGEYCEKLAKGMEEKLGIKIVDQTNFT